MLAKRISQLSDGEVSCLGTTRIKNLDEANRINVRDAIERFEKAPRGSLLLCRAFYNQSTRRGEQELVIAERAGFVVWKDRSIVSFYCNELVGTPKLNMRREAPHPIRCLHGMVKTRRWKEEESMNATIVEISSIIMAYSWFMNGVDRFDQLRSSHTTARKEARTPMSVFTFLLDASILNGYTLHRYIAPEFRETILLLREFKRCVGEIFLAPFLAMRQERVTVRPQSEQRH